VPTWAGWFDAWSRRQQPWARRYDFSIADWQGVVCRIEPPPYFAWWDRKSGWWVVRYYPQGTVEVQVEAIQDE